VIGGAQIIMRLIERFPVLIVAGGGLLGFVAGEIAIEDSAIADWVHTHAAWLNWVAPVAGIALVIGPAKWLRARHTARQQAPMP
jgi:predicted tellurium resistance membrane protein TerC